MEKSCKKQGMSAAGHFKVSGGFSVSFGRREQGLTLPLFLLY